MKSAAARIQPAITEPWPPVPPARRNLRRKADGRGAITIDGPSLSLNLGRGYSTVIDRTDYDIIKLFTWCVLVNPRTDKAPYAITTAGGRLIYMHRLLLNLPYGDPREGDHRDGNGLNNRRGNLRVATRAQNATNVRHRGAKRDAQYSHVSTRFKGVYYISKFPPGTDRRRTGKVCTNGQIRDAHLRGTAPRGREGLPAQLQGWAADGLTLEEVGQRLGVSRERARQLYARCGIERQFIVRATKCQTAFPWRAMLAGQRLGAFATEIEAALAYNEAAARRYGEWARLNVVEMG